MRKNSAKPRVIFELQKDRSLDIFNHNLGIASADSVEAVTNDLMSPVLLTYVI